MKSEQQWARTVALTMGVTAALLGVVPAVMRAWFPELHSEPLMRWVAGASALLLLLAGYVGRELLIPKREHAWIMARLHAERIKRHLWLWLVGASPYDTEGDNKERFRRNTLAVEKPTEPPPALDAGAVTGQRARDPLMNAPSDAPGRAELYVEKRLKDQIQWYQKKASGLQLGIERSRRLRFLFGAFTVGAGSTAVMNTPLPELIPLVTTLSAAVLAHLEAQRSTGLVVLYRRTADQLLLHWLGWHETDESARDITRLATVCEAIMERENGSWEAEQLSEDKLAQAKRSMDEVLQRDAGSTREPAERETS